MKKEVLIDSNIILRLLLADIELQTKKAKELLERIRKKEIRGLVSILVINEIIWILKRYYSLDQKVFIPKLVELFALPQLKVIEVKKSMIISILKKMVELNIDFTDCYLIELAGKRQIFSFDKDIKKMLN